MATLTKKHFIALAKIVGEEERDNPSIPPYGSVPLRQRVALFCREQNPAFEMQTFNAHCDAKRDGKR